MPELPEVETVRRSLLPLIGRTIRRVDVRLPAAIRTHRPVQFAKVLSGKSLRRVERRGKALLIYLSSGWVLVVHFKLWGLLRFTVGGVQPDRETAVIMHFKRGGALEFRELQLSTIELYKQRRLPRIEHLANLGVDPLSAEFTKERLWGLMMQRRVTVRALLTDQERIAGIGNLWAHEILHAAGLRPDRQAIALTLAEVEGLHQAVRRVLRSGIVRGGEPEFRDVLDRKGRVRLAVYGRAGQPCPRGDGTIVAARSGGRPSFFCPACQH
ncbi:MAG TPA: DNA-formamidopyrimidine glycosylase family protein [bacterium]|nr:DNA-formamidopyrimidine glycosylase family protein [bacterium]